MKIKKIRDIIIATGIGVALTTFIVFGAKLSKENNRRDKECSELVKKVITKAAGEDKVFSFEENVNLARWCGYDKFINSSYPLELYSNRGKFYFENKTGHSDLWNSQEIPRERLEEYLKH